MKDQNWTKWVLDAVNKIRTQKQCPSLERVIRAIRQHQNVSEASIKEQLESLVRDGQVLKIINKGQVSYKDPGCKKSDSGKPSTPLTNNKQQDKQTPIRETNNHVIKEPQTKEKEVLQKKKEHATENAKSPRKKKRSSVIEESPKVIFSTQKKSNFTAMNYLCSCFIIDHTWWC